MIKLPSPLEVNRFISNTTATNNKRSALLPSLLEVYRFISIETIGYDQAHFSNVTVPSRGR